jgi:hypothetical protein
LESSWKGLESNSIPKKTLEIVWNGKWKEDQATIKRLRSGGYLTSNTTSKGTLES